MKNNKLIHYGYELAGDDIIDLIKALGLPVLSVNSFRATTDNVDRADYIRNLIEYYIEKKIAYENGELDENDNEIYVRIFRDSGVNSLFGEIAQQSTDTSTKIGTLENEDIFKNFINIWFKVLNERKTNEWEVRKEDILKNINTNGSTQPFVIVSEKNITNTILLIDQQEAITKALNHEFEFMSSSGLGVSNRKFYIISNNGGHWLATICEIEAISHDRVKIDLTVIDSLGAKPEVFKNDGILSDTTSASIFANIKLPNGYELGNRTYVRTAQQIKDNYAIKSTCGIQAAFNVGFTSGFLDETIVVEHLYKNAPRERVIRKAASEVIKKPTKALKELLNKLENELSNSAVNLENNKKAGQVSLHPDSQLIPGNNKKADQAILHSDNPIIQKLIELKHAVQLVIHYINPIFQQEAAIGKITEALYYLSWRANEVPWSIKHHEQLKKLIPWQNLDYIAAILTTDREKKEFVCELSNAGFKVLLNLSQLGVSLERVIVLYEKYLNFKKEFLLLQSNLNAGPDIIQKCFENLKLLDYFQEVKTCEKVNYLTIEEETVLYIDEFYLSHLKEHFKAFFSEQRDYKNEFHRVALFRLIELIGEYSKNISQKFKDQNKFIPWNEIALLRNALEHPEQSGKANQNIKEILEDFTGKNAELLEQEIHNIFTAVSSSLETGEKEKLEYPYLEFIVSNGVLGIKEKDELLAKLEIHEQNRAQLADDKYNQTINELANYIFNERNKNDDHIHGKVELLSQIKFKEPVPKKRDDFKKLLDNLKRCRSNGLAGYNIEFSYDGKPNKVASKYVVYLYLENEKLYYLVDSQGPEELVVGCQAYSSIKNTLQQRNTTNFTEQDEQEFFNFIKLNKGGAKGIRDKINSFILSLKDSNKDPEYFCKTLTSGKYRKSIRINDSDYQHAVNSFCLDNSSLLSELVRYWCHTKHYKPKFEDPKNIAADTIYFYIKEDKIYYKASGAAENGIEITEDEIGKQDYTDLHKVIKEKSDIKNCRKILLKVLSQQGYSNLQDSTSDQPSVQSPIDILEQIFKGEITQKQALHKLNKLESYLNFKIEMSEWIGFIYKQLSLQPSNDLGTQNNKRVEKDINLINTYLNKLIELIQLKEKSNFQELAKEYYLERVGELAMNLTDHAYFQTNQIPENIAFRNLCFLSNLRKMLAHRRFEIDVSILNLTVENITTFMIIDLNQIKFLISDGKFIPKVNNKANVKSNRTTEKLIYEKAEDIKKLSAKFGIQSLKVIGRYCLQDSMRSIGVLSDLDLIVEHDTTSGLLEQLRFEWELSDLLDCNVKTWTERQFIARFSSLVDPEICDGYKKHFTELDTFLHHIRNKIQIENKNLKRIVPTGLVRKKDFSELFETQQEIDDFWQALLKSGYIDLEGKITDKFRELKSSSEMQIGSYGDYQLVCAYSAIREALYQNSEHQVISDVGEAKAAGGFFVSHVTDEVKQKLNLESVNFQKRKLDEEKELPENEKIIRRKLLTIATEYQKKYQKTFSIINALLKDSAKEFFQAIKLMRELNARLDEISTKVLIQYFKEYQDACYIRNIKDISFLPSEFHHRIDGSNFIKNLIIEEISKNQDVELYNQEQLAESENQILKQIERLVNLNLESIYIVDSSGNNRPAVELAFQQLLEIMLLNFYDDNQVAPSEPRKNTHFELELIDLFKELKLVKIKQLIAHNIELITLVNQFKENEACFESHVSTLGGRDHNATQKIIKTVEELTSFTQAQEIFESQFSSPEKCVNIICEEFLAKFILPPKESVPNWIFDKFQELPDIAGLVGQKINQGFLNKVQTKLERGEHTSPTIADRYYYERDPSKCNNDENKNFFSSILQFKLPMQKEHYASKLNLDIWERRRAIKDCIELLEKHLTNPSNTLPTQKELLKMLIEHNITYVKRLKSIQHEAERDRETLLSKLQTEGIDDISKRERVYKEVLSELEHGDIMSSDPVHLECIEIDLMLQREYEKVSNEIQYSICRVHKLVNDIETYKDYIKEHEKEPSNPQINLLKEKINNAENCIAILENKIEELLNCEVVDIHCMGYVFNDTKYFLMLLEKIESCMELAQNDITSFIRHIKGYELTLEEKECVNQFENTLSQLQSTEIVISEPIIAILSHYEERRFFLDLIRNTKYGIYKDLSSKSKDTVYSDKSAPIISEQSQATTSSSNIITTPIMIGEPNNDPGLLSNKVVSSQPGLTVSTAMCSVTNLHSNNSDDSSYPVISGELIALDESKSANVLRTSNDNSKYLQIT